MHVHMQSNLRLDQDRTASTDYGERRGSLIIFMFTQCEDLHLKSSVNVIIRGCTQCTLIHNVHYK